MKPWQNGGNTMNSHSEREHLTVEQFALRLQVSRSTVFNWKKNGRIFEGVHYFRIDRTLRFYWPFVIAAEPEPQIDVNVECKSLAAVRPPGKRRRGIQPTINIDY
jgi:hypothetical protein